MIQQENWNFRKLLNNEIISWFHRLESSVSLEFNLHTSTRTCCILITGIVMVSMMVHWLNRCQEWRSFMKRKLGGLRQVAVQWTVETQRSSEWPQSIPVISRSVEDDMSRDHTQVQNSWGLHTVMCCSIRSPVTRTHQETANKPIKLHLGYGVLSTFLNGRYI